MKINKAIEEKKNTRGFTWTAAREDNLMINKAQ